MKKDSIARPEGTHTSYYYVYGIVLLQLYFKINLKLYLQFLLLCHSRIIY